MFIHNGVNDDTRFGTEERMIMAPVLTDKRINVEWAFLVIDPQLEQ